MDRTSQWSAADLRLLFEPHVNSLLIGSAPAVRAALGVITSEGIAVHTRFAGTLLPLPTDDLDVLVIRHVDLSPPFEQATLLAWLDRNSHIKVISTSSRSLVPLVLAGTFSAELYYRLNTICVDLDAEQSPE